MAETAKPRHIMLVAGETSGDALGGPLMQAMKKLSPVPLTFSGVGGERMLAEGMESVFPMTDIAVMGPKEIIARLPLILKRMRETSNHALETRPDLIVMIDAPEFTHNVARRIARKAPEIRIIDYVAPTVWAWRQGRAKAMAKKFRRVLALLPFEPQFFAAHAGLECVYVGHPAIERVPEEGAGEVFRDRHGIPQEAPLLAVLPGSRTNEVNRLTDLFGETLAVLARTLPDLHAVVPTVPHVRETVRAKTADWPVRTVLTEGEAEKFAAFDAADAALAASGTVALELGLARVPMVIAYRSDPVTAFAIGRMLKVPSVVLPNLILDRPSIREFLGDHCKPEYLAAALVPLLKETPERKAALADLEEMRAIMGTGGEAPSIRAARAVLDLLPGK